MPYACPFFSCYLLPLKPFAYGTAVGIHVVRRPSTGLLTAAVQ